MICTIFCLAERCFDYVPRTPKKSFQFDVLLDKDPTLPKMEIPSGTSQAFRRHVEGWRSSKEA
jgi:hypothetical protein